MLYWRTITNRIVSKETFHKREIAVRALPLPPFFPPFDHEQSFPPSVLEMYSRLESSPGAAIIPRSSVDFASAWGNTWTDGRRHKVKRERGGKRETESDAEREREGRRAASARVRRDEGKTGREEENENSGEGCTLQWRRSISGLHFVLGGSLGAPFPSSLGLSFPAHHHYALVFDAHTH